MRYLNNIDDYGVNLLALRDRAIIEGLTELVDVFTAAINRAIDGDTTWYTAICRDIGFMITNTTMDALRVDPKHLLSLDNTEVE